MPDFHPQCIAGGRNELQGCDSGVGSDLSEVRACQKGNDAHGRVPVFLCMRELQRGAAAEGGRLLCVLLVWNGAVSAGADATLLLWGMNAGLQ